VGQPISGVIGFGAQNPQVPIFFFFFFFLDKIKNLKSVLRLEPANATGFSLRTRVLC
jgi:hypothetical protein